MSQAKRVLSRARAAGVRIVVAESMTGGLVSSLLTAPSGASAVFAYGLVVYNAAAKRALLNVSPELLARNGEVSAQVAQAMLRGLLARTANSLSTPSLSTLGLSTLGLSLTGYAGPKSSAHEEVGLMYLAAGFADGAAQVEEHRITTTGRENLRRAGAETGLRLIERVLGTRDGATKDGAPIR